MAGADNIVINVRERPLSTDINDLQSLKDRMLLELLQELGTLREDNRDASAASGVSETIRDYVVGGLGVSVSSTGGGPHTYDVDPGTLLQFSTTITPTPGSLDSPYRIGTLRTAVTGVALTPPASGNTFVLIQAQVVQVVASSQSRDILDLNGQFNPTLVDKRIERRVQFSTKEGGSGTAVIPTADTDWVPLLAVLWDGSVFINPFDVRPFMASRGLNPVRNTSSPIINTQSYMIDRDSVDTYKADFDVVHRGEHLYMRTAEIGGTPQIDDFLSTATDTTGRLEPGTVLVQDSIIYHYLGIPANRVIPFFRSAASALHGRGYFVTSLTPPDPQTLVNSASITLPYGGGTIPAGFGVCVGASYVNFGATDFRGHVQTRGGRCIIGNPDNFALVNVLGGTVTINFDSFAGRVIFPVGATTALINVRVLDATTTTTTLNVRPNGVTNNWGFIEADIATADVIDPIGPIALPLDLTRIWDFVPLGGPASFDLFVGGWEW